LHENFDLQIQMVHQQNNVDLNDVRSVCIGTGVFMYDFWIF
jgi:hypothetical protein